MDYLHILKFTDNATNLFLIADDGESALIDAHIGSEANNIKASIEQILIPNKLKQVILTHYHLDHIGACPILEEYFRPTFSAHPADAWMIEDPWPQFLELYHYSDTTPASLQNILQTVGGRGVKVNRLLRDGDRVEVGSVKLDVMHTPGHTMGSICLYDPANKALFAGDTLTPSEWFDQWLGLVVDARSFWISLQRIASLPIEVLLRSHESVLTGSEARGEVVKHIERFKEIESVLLEELSGGGVLSLGEIRDVLVGRVLGEPKNLKGSVFGCEWKTAHSLIQKLCFDGRVKWVKGELYQIV
ncbi:MAG: MBL fold metallo-hydrolase [Candidatus Bathyarchaeota archaeon]|nr:MBL fold metallo-hydrolase [Candidatus Bathyarchaeota archaeon]